MKIINTIENYHLLKQKSESFNEDELKDVDELLRISKELENYLLIEKKAAGISAPQLGLFKRIFSIKIDKKIFTCINPILVEKSREDVVWESCMSFPDIDISTIEHKKISTKFLTFNPKNNLYLRPFNFDNFQAILFQHELNHLDGILHFDKFDEEKIQPLLYLPFPKMPVYKIYDENLKFKSDYFIKNENVLLFNNKQISENDYENKILIGYKNIK